MNREISFTIFDKPLILKCHRHKKTGGTYDPQKKDKLYLGILIKRAVEEHCSIKEQLLHGPISINIKFFFGLPKTKRLRDKKGLYNTDRKDLDNAVKALLDVCSGILYSDDASVYNIIASKFNTDTKPRTEVIIKEVMQESIIKENHENTSVEGSERSHLSSSNGSSQGGGVSSSKDTSVKNIIPATVPNDKNY